MFFFEVIDRNREEWSEDKQQNYMRSKEPKKGLDKEYWKECPLNNNKKRNEREEGGEINVQALISVHSFHLATIFLFLPPIVLFVFSCPFSSHCTLSLLFISLPIFWGFVFSRNFYSWVFTFFLLPSSLLNLDLIPPPHFPQFLILLLPFLQMFSMLPSTFCGVFAESHAWAQSTWLVKNSTHRVADLWVTWLRAPRGTDLSID